MGILEWLGIGENTLYFPGCTAKAALKEEVENYKAIFNKLDIAFISLTEKEVCCGMIALNAGYKKEARKLAKKNYDLLKTYNIKKIITSSPSCYTMFKELYPTLLREWDIEVELALISILKALKKQGIDFKGTLAEREPIIYHDSCHLGRYQGIYEEPREIITRLGGKILEMKTNKEQALCCGAEGGVITHYPELAKKAAYNRIKEAPNHNARIISASGLCHLNLKKVTDKSQELSTYILEKIKDL